MMKKYIFITLFIISLFSCMEIFFIGDVLKPTQQLSSFSSECGDVLLSPAKKDSMVYLRFSFLGDNYFLDKNKLKFQGAEVNNIVWASRKIKEASRYTKIITDTCKVVSNEVIFVYFTTNETNLFVLPCDFIMCNNKPLLTDTIKIVLK